ncbi:hypothetical protein E1B28_006661 [Marasmius oreades]|uniref:phytol kinase n=1 Tax=Marasmius oreades TaxID=181124 RepID=A0A9P7UWK5_9AGAR|nr:uncharacterized protein E1B28_006661 [Marasmius oreades]KAG7095978.1 hypothetical protein E1B28_006661 [Marasmius oreades]
MVRSNSSPHSERESCPSVGMREIKEKARLVGRAPKVFALSSQVLGFLSLLRDVGNHANQRHTEYLVSWVAHDQWKTFFEPWLKSCMEDLIIHPRSSSSDMEIARETAMENISWFFRNIVRKKQPMPNLSNDSPHRVVDSRVLKQIQDHLKELIVVCWEKVAEEKPAITCWGPWSDLVLLVEPEIGLATKRRDSMQTRAFGTLGLNFHSKFASGLERLAQEIPSMSSDDLLNVANILLVLFGRIFAARSYEGPHDLELVLKLVQGVTSLLTAHMQDVGCEGVRAVVDAGILKLFLTAHPLFTSDSLFQTLWTDLLETITRFLVYPDILHRFLQARRRLVKRGLDDDTVTIPEPCTPWNRAKVKAFGVRQLRRTMNVEDALHVCANHPKCSSADSSTPFKRCSRCEKVSYCSYACQKSHWNVSHRDECLKIRNNLYLTMDTRHFLKCFATTTLSLHTSALRLCMAAYASAIDPLTTEDDKRIRMNAANPFIFLNLDIPGLPTLESFEVLNVHGFVDLMEKTLAPRSVPFIQDIVAEWRETTINDVYIFSRFPVTLEDTDVSVLGFVWRLDGHIIFL